MEEFNGSIRGSKILTLALLAAAMGGMHTGGGVDPEPISHEPFRRDVRIKPRAPKGKQQRKRNRKR